MIKIKCTYTKEDIEKIVLEKHKEIFPLPSGLRWSVINFYGEIEIGSVPDEKPNEETIND